MNKIIANVSIAKQCVPVKLEVTCESLVMSTEPIIFNRNGVTVIPSLVICLDTPMYAGCYKVNFNDTVGPTGVVGGTFTDISLSGGKDHDPKQVTFDATVISNSKYKYALELKPQSNIAVLVNPDDASCFSGCKFEFKLDTPIILADIPSKCNTGFSCKRACGGLTACTYIPVPGTLNLLEVTNLIACNVVQTGP